MSASAWHELHRSVVMPYHCDVYGHMNVRHYAGCFDTAARQSTPLPADVQSKLAQQVPPPA